VFLKPPSLSFEEACSLPVVGTTVLECFRRALPSSGERYLSTILFSDLLT